MLTPRTSWMASLEADNSPIRVKELLLFLKEIERKKDEIVFSMET
jgi:hypothetical protein